MLPEAKTSLNT